MLSQCASYADNDRNDANCFEGAVSSWLGCVLSQKTCMYVYTIFADMLTVPRTGHQQQWTFLLDVA